MGGLERILETPFSQLRLEEQLLVASLLLCCGVLAVYAISIAARRLRPTRRHMRQLIGRPILISWRDDVGFRESDDGICQNISRGGMALELPFPFKVRTRLNFRMSEAKLSGTGVVRRCTRVGSRYVVGVRFDSPIDIVPKRKL